MPKMRRFKQLLSHEVCEAVLKRNTSGVLTMIPKEGYPYPVPLSYVYDDGKLYFHCAKEGYKLEVLKENAKVAFCVIDQDEIVPEKYTTYFRSVIAYGKARILETKEEMYAPILKLCERYVPHNPEGHEKEIASAIQRMKMIEVTIEEMTGKEAIELVRGKENER